MLRIARTVRTTHTTPNIARIVRTTRTTPNTGSRPLSSRCRLECAIETMRPLMMPPGVATRAPSEASVRIEILLTVGLRFMPDLTLSSFIYV